MQEKEDKNMKKKKKKNFLTASRPRIISERDETEKPVQNCS